MASRKISRKSGKRKNIRRRTLKRKTVKRKPAKSRRNMKRSKVNKSRINRHRNRNRSRRTMRNMKGGGGLLSEWIREIKEEQEKSESPVEPELKVADERLRKAREVREASSPATALASAAARLREEEVVNKANNANPNDSVGLQYILNSPEDEAVELDHLLQVRESINPWEKKEIENARNINYILKDISKHINYYKAPFRVYELKKLWTYINSDEITNNYPLNIYLKYLWARGRIIFRHFWQTKKILQDDAINKEAKIIQTERIAIEEDRIAREEEKRAIEEDRIEIEEEEKRVIEEERLARKKRRDTMHRILEKYRNSHGVH